MSLLHEVAKATATPSDEAAEELIQLIVQRDAVAVVERVKRRLEADCSLDFDGLMLGLDRWLAGGPRGTSKLTWDESMGLVRSRLISHELADSVTEVLNVASFLQSRASFSDWKVVLASPIHVRWGASILHATGSIEVAEAGAVCRILTGDPANENTYERGSTVATGPGWSQLPRVTFDDVSIPLLVSDQGLNGRLPNSQICAQPQSFVEQIQGALHLASEFAPAYLRWVLGAVTAIVPVEKPANQYVSGSDHQRPGTIAICSGLSAATTLELLVHEAAHQRFFIFERLSPVSDAADCSLHYSPLPQAMRTIDRVLLAHHACVNIAACFQELERSGAPILWHGSEKQRQTSDRIRQMTTTIRHCTSLSQGGKALADQVLASSKHLV